MAIAAEALSPNGHSANAPVLIGFAESLAAPETAWSLIEAGSHVVAFARRGTRSALRRSKVVEIIEVTPPESDLGQTIAELTRLMEATPYSGVMPLDDAAIWICDAVSKHGPGVPVVGPTDQAALLALDKRLQIAAAERAGFQIPRTDQIRSIDDLMSVSEFPTVLKPERPVTQQGNALVRGANYVCANRSELEKVASSWRGSEPLLAQPLLSGTGEGLFGLIGPRGLLALSAHRRIRMVNPQGSGSSACMSGPVDPRLASRADQMLSEARWSGVFMLEFLRATDGTAWFMELNARPWGSMALARRNGLEYPAWAVALRADSRFEPTCPAWQEGEVCRHLGRELIHLAMVLRGPQSTALTEWPSRWRTARDVLRFRRSEHWYNWHARDRSVFVEDTVATVLDQVRRAARR